MEQTKQVSKTNDAKDTIIIIRNGFEQLQYNIMDLKETDELSIGHLFTAVRAHFNKKPSDYGSKWIYYRGADYEVQPAFLEFKKVVQDLPNDYERLVKVLSHLGETI